jgi:hypothetical protein
MEGTRGILIVILVFLIFASLQLYKISSLLELLHEDRILRVTEVVSNNDNKYDITSYGTVVLPDEYLVGNTMEKFD